MSALNTSDETHRFASETMPVEVSLLRALALHREQNEVLIEQVQDLVEARDKAVDEVQWLHIENDRAHAELDAKENELVDVKLALIRKEEELAALMENLSQQATRLQQLESTLQMLAEADGNG